MPYVCHLEYIYTITNKLQNSIVEVLKKVDRVTTPAARITEFKAQIIGAIHAENAVHRKCKPVHAIFEKVTYASYEMRQLGWDDFSLSLSCGSNNLNLVNFYIYQTL